MSDAPLYESSSPAGSTHEPDLRPSVFQAKVGVRAEASGLHLAWAYTRHEILYVCWALMDIALIAPLALAVMSWTRPWPRSAFVVWLFLVLLIPFNLSRLMSITGIDPKRQRNVMLATFILSFLLALRSLLFQAQSLFDLRWISAFASRVVSEPGSLWRREMALFILLVYLWSRGMTLTNREVAVTEVGFRLRFGGLLLALLAVVLSIIPAAGSAIPFIMLFFVAALVAVAISRAEEVSLHERGTTYPMSPRWIVPVFLTSLFVVSIAALTGLALSGEGLSRLLQWLAPLFNAFTFGSMVIITTVTYFLLFLITPFQQLIRYLFQLFSGLGLRGLPEIEPPAPDQSPIDQLLLELGDPQSNVYLWFNRGAISFLVALALIVLLLTLRRYFLNREVSFETTEAGRPAPALVGGQKGFAHRLLNRFERWRRWRAAATVRQLYHSMSMEAADRGYPRPLSETPFEYLPLLDEAWPAGTDDVRMITDAYVRVRYGEVPETSEEVQRLRDAWRRLAKSPPANELPPDVSETE